MNERNYTLVLKRISKDKCKWDSALEEPLQDKNQDNSTQDTQKLSQIELYSTIKVCAYKRVWPCF